MPVMPAEKYTFLHGFAGGMCFIRKFQIAFWKEVAGGMAFLKNLFGGRSISDAEQARRQGTRYISAKSVAEMSEEEKREYWRHSRELPDMEERMRRMTELADAGFISAYTTIFDTLFARAETANSKVPLEQLEYWAGRAAKAGHINGHFYLGLVYETPEYLQRDYETYMAKSLQEYLLAMEMENENAPQRLERLWNHEFTSSQYSAEESRQAQAFFREQMKAWLEPELKRLREQDDEEACCAFGQMYLYGILYEQDLAKARHYFKRLADAGREFGTRMLANPLFDEEDEDEE